MIPKDIDKWDNNQWTRFATYCRPSSGGAVGVVFVWSGTVWSSATGHKGDGYKNKEAAFVIKPIQGSAAPTKFAEHLLSKIAGAHSPNSKPIPRRSPGGSGIALMMKMFRDKETDSAVKARWQQVFQNYDRADAFLIQETQIAIKEFGDEYRESGGLQKILTDQTLMTNLGKLFAADALIGNGDRLSNMNTGNIIFKPDGTLCSIDTTTILTNFQAILNDSTGSADSTGMPGGITPHQWASQDIVNHGFGQVPSPAQQQNIRHNNDATNPSQLKPVVLAPSMPVKQIFDVDNWWKDVFRPHFEKGLAALKPPLPSPPENVWNQAQIWFKAGTNEGIRQIDSKLSGLNWLMIKSKYKNFVGRYGGDPNLDWTNFKIRRMYIKIRKSGKSEEQALKTIQDYVARKML